jgi:hypothetical protein
MSEPEFKGLRSVPLSAFVENVDADTVRIIAAPGYDLALFQPPGQPVEVMIVGDDDTWRLRIREATSLETLTITFPERRVIQFKYGNLFG